MKFSTAPLNEYHNLEDDDDDDGDGDGDGGDDDSDDSNDQRHCKEEISPLFLSRQRVISEGTGMVATGMLLYTQQHTHPALTSRRWVCRNSSYACYWKILPVPVAARSKAVGVRPARLLRLCVRIPPEAWMSVCCECCVLSGRGLCDGLISRPEESYRLWCVVVWCRKNLKNEEAMARDWAASGIEEKI